MNVAEDNDVFAAERERVNMIINSYNDGESCQRVERKFSEVLNEKGKRHTEKTNAALQKIFIFSGKTHRKKR